MPTEPTVCYAVDADVAYLRLNRPDRLNAVVPRMVEDLCTSLQRAEADQAGAVVLYGAGRAFCAGHDLKEDQASSDPVSLRAQVQRIQDVTRLVRRLPCPVIAAVHGYALGAGCEFALCADLVVAGSGAVFGFPEVEVGLTVTGGISQVLPTAVGLAKAKELLLAGDRFSADQAADWGLVNRVVADDDLLSEAAQLAGHLVQRPRHSLALAKRVLDAGVGANLEQALEMEAEHAVLAMASADAAAAAARFRERA